MTSDHDRCFWNDDGAPCNLPRTDHKKMKVAMPRHAFTGPASDAGLRVLVEQWRAAAAGLPTEADDYGREEAYAVTADELELVLNAPTAAVCDVAREPCVKRPDGYCASHITTTDACYGKFEAAGGKQ